METHQCNSKKPGDRMFILTVWNMTKQKREKWVIHAQNREEAEERADRLCSSNNLQYEDLSQGSNYRYVILTILIIGGLAELLGYTNLL